VLNWEGPEALEKDYTLLDVGEETLPQPGGGIWDFSFHENFAPEKGGSERALQTRGDTVFGGEIVISILTCFKVVGLSFSFSRESVR